MDDLPKFDPSYFPYVDDMSGVEKNYDGKSFSRASRAHPVITLIEHTKKDRFTFLFKRTINMSRCAGRGYQLFNKITKQISDQKQISRNSAITRPHYRPLDIIYLTKKYH